MGNAIILNIKKCSCFGRSNLVDIMNQKKAYFKS